MSKLIPSPELSTKVSTTATPAECIAMWVDLLNAGDKLLRIALRRSVGPDGDIQSALRDWYTTNRNEHDRAVARMISNDRSPRSV